MTTSACGYCRTATICGGAPLARRSFPRCSKLWFNLSLKFDGRSSGGAAVGLLCNPPGVRFFHQPLKSSTFAESLISSRRKAAVFRRDATSIPASDIVQQLDQEEEGPAASSGEESRRRSSKESQESEPDKSSAGASKASSKLCASCAHSKHIVDFEKKRGGSELRSDLCRACLAAIRAERVGLDLHHLSLTVEESWERAKACPRCRVVKELRDFGRNVRKAEGIDIYCRACKCQMERQQPDRAPAPETTPLPCNRCGETKPAAEFALDKKRLRGRAVICKECFAERRRQLYRRHKAAEVLARTQPKHCVECGVEKAVDEFHKNRAAVDGLQDKCKACCNAYNSRRRAAGKARQGNGASQDTDQGLPEGDDEAKLSAEALEVAAI